MNETERRMTQDDLGRELTAGDDLPVWKIEMLRAIIKMERPMVLMPRQYRDMLREVDDDPLTP